MNVEKLIYAHNIQLLNIIAGCGPLKNIISLFHMELYEPIEKKKNTAICIAPL
jgi:hypothetical protein